MTLADIATFTTTISGLAVTASLIYLALQTHQAAKHTRALIQQGRATRMVEFLVGFSDSERAAAIVVAGGGEPTVSEIRQQQARMYYSAIVFSCADLFEQHEAGLLSENQFADLRASIVTYLGRAEAGSIWQTWKALRPHSHAKFKAWVDGIVASPPEAAANTTGRA